MSNVIPLFKGLPITEERAIDALKEFDEEILTIFYLHSNDLVQKILIEEICRLKGFVLPTETEVA